MSDIKPRVRFRDYRCSGCGRLLMRANLDTLPLSLPINFSTSNPLMYSALRALAVECRCPKCGATNVYNLVQQTNGHAVSVAPVGITEGA